MLPRFSELRNNYVINVITIQHPTCTQWLHHSRFLDCSDEQVSVFCSLVRRPHHPWCILGLYPLFFPHWLYIYIFRTECHCSTPQCPVHLVGCYYRLAQNFRGSLISRISRISNRSRNYFNENFWHVKHMQKRRWTTSRSYLGVFCRIRKGRSTKRYLRSRHCFAHNCELERGRRSRQCVLDRTCLYATPILHYVTAWAWFRQRIREFISSKTAIRENLDPRKFSAVRYKVYRNEKRC